MTTFVPDNRNRPKYTTIADIADRTSHCWHSTLHRALARLGRECRPVPDSTRRPRDGVPDQMVVVAIVATAVVVALDSVVVAPCWSEGGLLVLVVTKVLGQVDQQE